MKKMILVFLLFPALLFAQEKTDSLSNWKKGGMFSANFSQVSLSNCAAGGKSSMSGVFMINSFANYKKDSLSWDNTVDFSYGFLKEDNNDLVKSSDKIDFNSKLGYNTGSNWNYAALVNFKSQFAPGYAYPRTNDENAISRFLAPAYISVATGMDYKTDNMSLFLSPVSGKFTIVNDDVMSAAGAYGVDPGEKFRAELGAMLKFGASKEILKNVTAQTKLDLFSNYFHNPQNIDVDWSVLINMKVNEYLSANLVTQLIYDDDIRIDGKQRIQFMEMFGVGLSVKF